MTTVDLDQMRASYDTVANAVGEHRARQHGWPAARDATALERVLDDISTDDLIVDLGCCGVPWVTAYLTDAGYSVVGVDIPKPQWGENSLSSELGLDLVEYDGSNLPFGDDSASLVLMFGVLEHVGVWKTDSEKYTHPNPEINSHRKAVLEEASRVLTDDGKLLLTKFPNRHGYDKLYAPDGGHLDSERTVESDLRSLLSESFNVKKVYRRGMVPYRLPWSAPSDRAARSYTQFDGVLSSIPLFSRVSQCFGAVASPRQ